LGHLIRNKAHIFVETWVLIDSVQDTITCQQIIASNEDSIASGREIELNW
jgi:hypothetical protein